MVGSWWEIPYERYLSDALMLSAVEQARLAAALDCLPAEIIDAHTYVARSIDVVALSPSSLTHVISTYPCYTLEDSRRVRERLWPGKRVRALRMAYPIEGYRHCDINEYLVANANLYEDIVGGYGIPDDINYTLQLIDSGHIHALKMYYRYREPGVGRILGIFPAPILQQAQERDIPIILTSATAAASVPRRTDRGARLVSATDGGAGASWGTWRAAVRPNNRSCLRASGALLACVHGYCVCTRCRSNRKCTVAVRTRTYPPTEVRRATPTLLHIQQVEAVLTALRSFSCDAVNAVFYRNAAQLFGLAPYGTV
jgi:hypothetical protein